MKKNEHGRLFSIPLSVREKQEIKIERIEERKKSRKESEILK
jgi:hypothetical protein